MDPALFVEPSGELLLVRREAPGADYWSFLPAPLPPPQESACLRDVAALLADASHALGQLDGIGQVLPNPDLLVWPYIRREAVLSSRIEGTQTSFSELVTVEAMGASLPHTEVREVLNYVSALHAGLGRMDSGGITIDLIRTSHRTLLAGARGEVFGTPGEFRTVQNHIDGRTTDPASARYVPPPPQYVPDAIETLVTYLGNDKPNTPLLVEAAWAHYQFEAIHPFLDGNGRVGRLMIPLLLASRRRLSHPLLYLSPYFDRHRTEYYDRLLAVSAAGDWLGWLCFFLQGVREQADEAIRLARAIIGLGETWKELLGQQSANRTAHRLAEFVLQHTAVDARTVERELGVATQTAYSAISVLERAGILRELTGRSRGRVYAAPALVEILEPLPPGAG